MHDGIAHAIITFVVMSVLLCERWRRQAAAAIAVSIDFIGHLLPIVSRLERQLEQAQSDLEDVRQQCRQACHRAEADKQEALKKAGGLQEQLEECRRQLDAIRQERDHAVEQAQSDLEDVRQQCRQACHRAEADKQEALKKAGGQQEQLEECRRQLDAIRQERDHAKRLCCEMDDARRLAYDRALTEKLLRAHAEEKNEKQKAELEQLARSLSEAKEHLEEATAAARELYNLGYKAWFEEATELKRQLDEAHEANKELYQHYKAQQRRCSAPPSVRGVRPMG